MAAETFLLKVITPVGVALEERVTSVTLPTAMGEVGILPQHAEYTAILGVGILSYFKGETSVDVRRLVIAGGICQFGGDTFSVLADAIDLPETIDRNTFAKNRAEFARVVDAGDTQSIEWQTAKDRLGRIDAISTLIGQHAA